MFQGSAVTLKDQYRIQWEDKGTQTSFPGELCWLLSKERKLRTEVSTVGTKEASNWNQGGGPHFLIKVQFKSL